MTLFYSLGGLKETVTGRILAAIWRRHSRNEPHNGCHRLLGRLEDIDLAGCNGRGRRQSAPPSASWSAGVGHRGAGRTTDYAARLAAGGILDFWTSTLSLWYSVGCGDGTGHTASDQLLCASAEVRQTK